VNKVILKGYLGDFQAHSDKLLTSSIQVKKPFPTDDSKYDFISLKFLGETKVGFVTKHLSKGSEVLVTGRLEQSRYTTKDGKNATSYAVVVEEIEFCGSKTETKTEPKADFVKVDKVEDGDLPFI